MFVASIASCYGVSLVGVSKRYHTEFNDFSITASGTLRMGEYGWEFDEVTLDVHITVSTDKDKKRMEKVAERAHRYCLVGTSLKCAVKLKYKVIVE